jgi:hypothetical protein
MTQSGENFIHRFVDQVREHFRPAERGVDPLDF